jgi:hypothetical protein
MAGTFTGTVVGYVAKDPEARGNGAIGRRATCGEVWRLSVFNDRQAEGACADQCGAKERRISDGAPVIRETNRAGGGKVGERRECRAGTTARYGADRQQPHPATCAINAHHRGKDLSAVGGGLAVRHEADRAVSTVRGGALAARRIF